MDTGIGAVEDSAHVQLSLGHLYKLYIYTIGPWSKQKL